MEERAKKPNQLKIGRHTSQTLRAAHKAGIDVELREPKLHETEQEQADIS